MLYAIQFNLIQQKFMGCLVCDSQCLAPEIEKWIWYGCNPGEIESGHQQIIVIDNLVI